MGSMRRFSSRPRPGASPAEPTPTRSARFSGSSPRASRGSGRGSTRTSSCRPRTVMTTVILPSRERSKPPGPGPRSWRDVLDDRSPERLARSDRFVDTLLTKTEPLPTVFGNDKLALPSNPPRQAASPRHGKASRARRFAHNLRRERKNSYFFPRNPLKSPDSTKQIQVNPNDFACICLDWLARDTRAG
jgi:hypothetical protein